MNLRAKRGIGATNKRLKVKVIRHKILGVNNAVYSFGSRTKEHTNMALAGVGKPIKESDWRVSLLNLAKRIAENIGIKKAT